MFLQETYISSTYMENHNCNNIFVVVHGSMGVWLCGSLNDIIMLVKEYNVKQSLQTMQNLEIKQIFKFEKYLIYF